MLYRRVKLVNEPPVAALSNAKLRLTSVNPVVVRPPNVKTPKPEKGWMVSAVFVVNGGDGIHGGASSSGERERPKHRHYTCGL